MKAKTKVFKKRKWYSTGVKPDRANNLIIMTDMGYMFEAVYKDGKFLVSTVREDRVYFEESITQDSIIKWMKI